MREKTIVTALNTAPLRDALAHIAAHPEEHDQSIYGWRTECGTTGCVAGHLLSRSAEWEPVWSPDRIDATLDGGRSITQPREFVRSVELVANRILGVTPELWSDDAALHEEAAGILEDMFDCDTSIEEIHALARKFYALAGEPE